MKNTQKGFGLIEALLIVVVVSLLGLGGWYAYSAHQKAIGVSNASSTTHPGIPQAPTSTVPDSTPSTTTTPTKVSTKTNPAPTPAPTPANPTSSAPQSTTPAPSSTTASATYNHGTPVPADSVARAKAAGYYCPSWDAAPGTNSAYYCVTLDQ